jgi:uncharacterized membrane protein
MPFALRFGSAPQLVQPRQVGLAAAGAAPFHRGGVDPTILPPQYWRYFRIWVTLGVPAFIAFVAIFWLMAAKPM